MNQKDKSAIWLAVIVALFYAILILIWNVNAQGAVNTVDQVQKLVPRGAASGDSLFIRNDSLIGNNIAVALFDVIKAVNKIEADTIDGGGSIVGIGPDTTRFDIDSTGTYVVLTFGGYGGGLQWNRATRKMQFTNDFVTWTDIGTGSGGTGDIDGVVAGDGLKDGGTSGTVTLNVLPGWGLRIHADSVKINYTQLSDSLAAGVDRDSIFVVHFSARWEPLSDSSAQYIGASGDSAFVIINKDSNYVETWGDWFNHVKDPDSLTSFTVRWVREVAGDSVAGLIRGVSGGTGLIGGGAEGEAVLSIDLTWLHEFLDSTLAVTYSDTSNVAREVLWSWLAGVLDTTSVVLQVEVGDISGITAGNGLTGDATSGAVTLNVVVGTSTGLATNADSVYVAAGGIGATQLASDAVTESKLKFVDTPVDEDIMTFESTTGDFEWHTPAQLNLALTSDLHTRLHTMTSTSDHSAGNWKLFYSNGSGQVIELALGTGWLKGNGVSSAPTISTITESDVSGVITDVTAGNGLINGASSGNATVDIQPGWGLRIDNDSAEVNWTHLKDSLAHSSTAPSIAGNWTLSGNFVNTANPWAVNEGGTGAATFTQNGILYGNGTSAVGVTAQGASGTVLHGNGGTPTFSAVVTGDITDGTIALADMSGNSVDSTKIVSQSIGVSNLDSLGKQYILDSLRLRSILLANYVTAPSGDFTLNGGGNAIFSGTKNVSIKHLYHLADTTTINDSIYNTRGANDARYHKVAGTRVRFQNVHGQDHPLGDACILSLEGFDAGGTYPYLYRDSSTATDAEDTVFLSTFLPTQVTQADSLILVWKTSSATGTTSRIISIDLYVTTGGGTAMSATQLANTTDYSETSITRTAIDLSSDGDFNGGEMVSLRIVFQGDANAFLKVYGAHLVCQ